MNPLKGKEETWQSSFQTATEHNYESEEKKQVGAGKKKNSCEIRNFSHQILAKRRKMTWVKRISEEQGRFEVAQMLRVQE